MVSDTLVLLPLNHFLEAQGLVLGLISGFFLGFALAGLGLGRLTHFFKTFDPAHGVDIPGFAGEQGVASRTDIDVNLGFGRTGSKSITASAGNDRVIVPLGVNLGFHEDIILYDTMSALG